MNSTNDNLVVEVVFDIEKDAEGYPKSRDVEAVLCKPVDRECSTCVVDSIPFYLRNVAYGDTIKTKNDEAGNLAFAEIVKRGGYSVYRILLRDPAKKDEVIANLLELGALVEKDNNLIAIAVSPATNPDPIVDYIVEGKRKHFWGAQDGFIFEGS
jgi:hypothetical protein